MTSVQAITNIELRHGDLKKKSNELRSKFEMHVSTCSPCRRSCKTLSELNREIALLDAEVNQLMVDSARVTAAIIEGKPLKAPDCLRCGAGGMGHAFFDNFLGEDPNRLGYDFEGRCITCGMC